MLCAKYLPIRVKHHMMLFNKYEPFNPNAGFLDQVEKRCALGFI